MGIINVTPDSFSDGGVAFGLLPAMRLAERHVAAGAAVLDIGGESTRPGARPVDASTQMRRILPVVEAIAAEGWPVALSVDTQAPQVAAAALDRGVQIINDITGLADPAMRDLIAARGCSAIVMHMRGTPASMDCAHLQQYDNVVADVKQALLHCLSVLHRASIAPHQLLIDPGIGFAKSTEQNWLLTRHLDELVNLGYPVVYGPSRKRFLAAAAATTRAQRDRATAAVCTVAVAAGAKVVRVHNVGAVRQAVAAGWALCQLRHQRASCSQSA